MTPADNKKAQQQQFDSEGFDLGATVDAEEGLDGGEGIVYEIGGLATTTCVAPSPKKARECDGDHPTDESERLKELGNVEFRSGNHLDAYDMYTEAIESCPTGEGLGPSGTELLRLRDEHEEARRERAAEAQRREMEKRRSRRKDAPTSSPGGGGGRDDDHDDHDDHDREERMDGDGGGGGGLGAFVPPRHVHGPKLAVYYANRAASLLHLGRYGECIDDCSVAIMYNPTYAKAYQRRGTAYERTERTDKALEDARAAYRLEPNNASSRKNVDRLSKIEEERLEKLKEETMGKLKDLGNSLLSNFGLSLDNFNAVQDPNTGGYSISFNQNSK
ncbi:hypothetical protein ACHAW5_010036 [Stephanodiscus triporus]|uniref:Tetratricopeptide repeat protein 1 n=1 Tax=Stephanodiscus triporus TaxID=2934178 RepID=A0ABD3QYE9_9STRA